MTVSQFIKAKIGITIFITFVFCIETIMLFLFSFYFINELWVKTLIPFGVFIIMFWVLTSQLIYKITKLDKETKKLIQIFLIGLYLSFIFIFISFFLWKKILNEINQSKIITRQKYLQSRFSFIFMNALFWILILYAWSILFFTISIAVSMEVGAMNIVIMTSMPIGLIAIGILIYLNTKFILTMKNTSDLPKMNFYTELLWITFFFPPLGIWLMIYISTKMTYLNEPVDQIIEVNNNPIPINL